ncbi:MAG TPA: pentapeptide repeat-containing protein [Allosphingosinicella sp.]|jgi:uncharacterized protein YjbI with pentapeptide repeats/uncharacterized protein YecT (DUF1311 family)
MSLIAALALAAASPPAGSCQAALGPLHEGTAEDAMPGRVDGATLNAQSLAALRRRRGAATITVVGGAFRNADFRAARLRNVCFLDTDLSGSDWRGADASGVGFVRSNLAGAKLEGARMPFVLLREPKMEGVNAAAADFSGGRLDGGWDGSMDDVVLARANLSRFEFACGITIGDACVSGLRVDLRGADLTGARLSDWNGDAAYMGARIDGTRIALHQLRDVADANLAGPILLAAGDVALPISAADHAALLPRLAAAAVAPPDAPSFDCGRARSRAERAICAADAYELRELDRDLAAVYGRAAAANPAVAARQRAWLAEREACAPACLPRMYEARIGELIAGLGTPQWARSGARALFVSERTEFLDSFRTDPLYLKILPVIVADAAARVIVQVHADGTIDADGDAIGGNAHSCSLGGERLRFDPRTGWYSGPFQRHPEDPPEWSERPMPVLRFIGDTAQVYRNGVSGWGEGSLDPRPSEAASCGARAHFPHMVRVPVSDAELDRMLAELAFDDGV